MTMNAREFMQTDVVLLGILLYAALGKVIDSGARAIERGALSWHPNFAPEARP
jgi:sulfonate transport system permease protein